MVAYRKESLFQPFVFLIACIAARACNLAVGAHQANKVKAFAYTFRATCCSQFTMIYSSNCAAHHRQCSLRWSIVPWPGDRKTYINLKCVLISHGTFSPRFFLQLLSFSLSPSTLNELCDVLKWCATSEERRKDTISRKLI